MSLKSTSMKSMSTKRRLAAAGLAAALALTGVAATTAGTAWAVTAETSSDTSSEESASQSTSIADRIIEALSGLVDDGTITADQASAVAQSLASSDAMRGGPGGRGHHGAMGGMHHGLDAAAEALGMTEDELRTALADGATLAEVAEEQGVAVDDLVDALVAGAEERLAEAVTDGRITQEQADEMAATLPDRIAEQVEQSWEPRGPGGHRGEGRDRMGQPDDGTTHDNGTDDGSTEGSSFDQSA